MSQVLDADKCKERWIKAISEGLNGTNPFDFRENFARSMPMCSQKVLMLNPAAKISEARALESTMYFGSLFIGLLSFVSFCDTQIL